MSYRDFEVEVSKVIPDVLVIKPAMNWDLRGNIYTSYAKDIYREMLGMPLDFIHDKFALSKANVLRGLHGDSKTWKLVSCVHGKLYEVVVDMRQESPTYRKWDSFLLDSEHYTQVLIPPRFVNGYYVLSPDAVFHYKLAYIGEYIDAGEQLTIAWNDPDLAIKWPCSEPILQARDVVVK
jgi:dTDP-4-dehydrorhamnose 3,5-epimerase